MSEPSPPPGVLAPIVVLVIEDEALIQDIVKTALEEAGYRTVSASTGDESIRLLEADDSTIRVLVTDVELTGSIKGWMVAKRSRELRPDIPVIYATGASAEEWAANGVPGSLLIRKPFAPAQIVTAVSQLLNAASSPMVHPGAT